MKRWVVCCIIFINAICSYAQATWVPHIDSLVAEINRGKFSNTVVINDTDAMLSGYKEREIKAYFSNGLLKKAVVKFRNSQRIREVYYGPGKDYENRVIYIKDYENESLALDLEVYVWERKLVKSIVTDPLNEDERNHPERVIDRANYEYLVKAKMKE